MPTNMSTKVGLSSPISALPFIGPTYQKKLLKLNIATVGDLIHHYPFRYENYSLSSPINQAQVGETLTVQGKVDSIVNSYTKSGKNIQKATIIDGSGKINAVWFNQTYLVNHFRKNISYRFSGKVGYFGREKTIVSPAYESTESAIHTGRLVPIYPETAGVTSKWLRSRIASTLPQVIDQIDETLPLEIRSNLKLIDERLALSSIHFPQNVTLVKQAKKRLAFDELVLLQLASNLRRRHWQKKQLEAPLTVDKKKINSFVNQLPYRLTSAQSRAAEEIVNDLGRKTPMNRLLQGDIGSGKTVVAAIAAFVAQENQQQTIIMAPTEVLARQHYQTFATFFKNTKVSIDLVTQGNKGAKLNSDILIGTHALLFKTFSDRKIGLIVVDEQHRFGVEQRETIAKNDLATNLLTMTATPIPRTIALAAFGDLEISTIDELPPGRRVAKTWLVPNQKRKDAYNWIRDRLVQNNDQAFVVCPYIDESENNTTVKAATIEFNRLKNIYPNLKIALLHGRQKPEEKQQILELFREGKYQILVATPVVEVGIDIPNATIILIETAENFGLAELHQLRGRVGRGSKPGYCFLFTENDSPQVNQRLKLLEAISQGNKLAEVDLRLRGPGDIFGLRQHGLSRLKIADYSNLELIASAKKTAEDLINGNGINHALQDELERVTISPIILN